MTTNVGYLDLIIVSTCSSSKNNSLYSSPTPNIFNSIPNRICVNTTNKIELNGSQFLQSPTPSLYLNNILFSSITESGCSSNLCNYINTTINANSLTVGEVNITVINGNGSCSSTFYGLLDVIPVPVIKNVTPAYCYDQGGILLLIFI